MEKETIDSSRNNLMCRLCLTTTNIQLLSNIIDLANVWPDKINKLTGIDIFEDFRYPQKICSICRKSLDRWFNFRTKCLLSQTRYKNEFLDKKVEETPSIETVLIKEEIIDSTNVDVKIEKELVMETDGWSDDDFFTLENPDDLESCIKSLVNQVDNKEEYFELITVVEDEIEIPLEVKENKEITEENDFTEDKYSSTESEPDLFGFDEPETEIPVIQKKVYRKRISPNPDLEYRREQDRLATIEWKNKNKKKKVQKLESKSKKEEVCHICGKTFHKKTSLEYHLNYHNDLRPFVCRFEGCNKTFNSPTIEQKHQLRHAEPKYVCSFCGMTFFDSVYLKRHLLKHTKNWKFVCIYCSKKCANKYNLKVHMRIHTGDRPFSCSKCKAAFAYNSLLKSHKEKCEKRNEESEESGEEECDE